MNKYGLHNNGWDACLARYDTFRSSWKFISRIYLAFHQFMTVVARGGDNKARFPQLLSVHRILINSFLILSSLRIFLFFFILGLAFTEEYEGWGSG